MIRGLIAEFQENSKEDEHLEINLQHTFLCSLLENLKSTLNSLEKDLKDIKEL